MCLSVGFGMTAHLIMGCQWLVILDAPQRRRMHLSHDSMHLSDEVRIVLVSACRYVVHFDFLGWHYSYWDQLSITDQSPWLLMAVLKHAERPVTPEAYLGCES